MSNGKYHSYFSLEKSRAVRCRWDFENAIGSVSFNNLENVEGNEPRANSRIGPMDRWTDGTDRKREKSVDGNLSPYTSRWLAENFLQGRGSVLAIACFWWSLLILVRCATGSAQFRRTTPIGFFLIRTISKWHHNKKNNNKPLFLRISKKNIAVFVFLCIVYSSLKSNEMYFYFLLSGSFFKPQDEGREGKFIDKSIL